MKDDSIKILLVDDTPENLVALQALLRLPRVTVVTARSGAEALERCLEHDFSLALLDVQMPEMDGFELAELMRGAEKTKHVPIIFVTAGSRDPARVFRGYESGAVDFLYKPVEPHVLASKVNVFVELAKQRQFVARSLQLNEMFVGILGHDLRNPLAAITTGLEVLDTMATTPGQTKVIDRMRSSSKRMSNMITELLDLTYARLAGPGLGLARSFEPLDLCTLLRRVIDELRVHGREIVLESSPECLVSADGERLQQLFSNLVGNALAHGRPEAPITVRLLLASESVTVEVHNLGTIPDEIADTLFEPFRRGAKRSRGGGLGLGLYIAQQIAKAHGGDIAVRSSEPAGTTFAVQLPREAVMLSAS